MTNNHFYDLPEELQQNICDLARPLKFIQAELTKKVEERLLAEGGLYRFKFIDKDDKKPIVGLLFLTSKTLDIIRTVKYKNGAVTLIFMKGGPSSERSNIRITF